MNKNRLLIGVIALLLIATVVLVNSGKSDKPAADNRPVAANSPVDAHGHSHGPSTPAAKVVPAFLQEPPSRSSLGPTLDPERFEGKTREAYRAAREIPVTIAQMPCYCYCDRGMGHKSLYSCFEDDHAAHCATCVNEALMALQLEKQEKLTAAQIRERIVAQFGD